MTGQLAHICRHPIKSHGREDLASVLLSVDQGLPMDRHWAVAHDAAKLVAGWNPCVNFARGSKAPGLMAISASLNENGREIGLHHPTHGSLQFQPDNPDDLPRFLDWVRPLSPPDRAQPVRIVTAGRIMSDTEYPSVSILNLASNTDLGQRMSMDLSPYRWRGNFWVTGWDAWFECDLIGKEIQIGEATLHVVEPIERCNATKANPMTGEIDCDTLGALSDSFGHRNFGIYARVIRGGKVALNDGITIL